MSDGERVNRGQLVLVAAVIVAVAFVPMVLASLQLGYHADVRASSDDGDPTADATAALRRGVHLATDDVPTEYAWDQRRDAVAQIRRDLGPRIDTVERARIDTGTARTITFNDSAASRWANETCPGGPGRSFGPCTAIDGVVVQERAGRTQPLGIVVDITITDQRGRTNATVRVPTVAGHE